MCIGAVFALVEEQIVLASVLQKFRLTLDSKRSVFPVGRLTIQPSFAPPFRLQPF
jgi:cytochrome P450